MWIYIINWIWNMMNCPFLFICWLILLTTNLTKVNAGWNRCFGFRSEIVFLSITWVCPRWRFATWEGSRTFPRSLIILILPIPETRDLKKLGPRPQVWGAEPRCRSCVSRPSNPAFWLFRSRPETLAWTWPSAAQQRVWKCWCMRPCPS